MKEIPIDTMLHTKRLCLQAIALSEVEMTWSARRFDGCNDGMIWDAPKRRTELVDRTQESLRQWKEGSLFTYTVTHIDASTPIGRVAIKQTNALHVGILGFGFILTTGDRGMRLKPQVQYWNSGFRRFTPQRLSPHMLFGIYETNE